jgi:transposase
MSGAEGMPLVGEAMDGNESDKAWNRRVIEELVEQFTDSLTELVYVAGAAVVTKDNFYYRDMMLKKPCFFGRLGREILVTCRSSRVTGRKG